MTLAPWAEEYSLRVSGGVMTWTRTDSDESNIELTYVWVHIPSSTQGESKTKKFYCVADLLRTINDWNAQQPLVWKYWWKPCLSLSYTEIREEP